MTEAEYISLKMQRQMFVKTCDMNKKENVAVLKYVDAGLRAGASRYDHELESSDQMREDRIKSNEEQAKQRAAAV